MNNDKELLEHKIQARRLCIAETERKIKEAIKEGNGGLAEASIALLESYKEGLVKLLEEATD